MDVSPWITAQCIGLFVCFAASAFFSITETAMIGVSRLDVRRKAEAGDRGAERLDRMLNDPERILSTVLVGNTIANISGAALGTAIAEQIFQRFATVIAAVFVTLVILVACELVPKTFAVRNSMRVALAVAPALRLVETGLKPFVAFGTWLSGVIVRSFGVKTDRKAPFITQDEIEMLVRLGYEQGSVEHFEQRVIRDVFQFTETDVHKLMTPAARVVTVPSAATLAEAARKVSGAGHSRILVVDGGFENVLGFVHIKDLLRYSDQEMTALPVTVAVRRCMVATADTPADHLLVRMQKERRTLAVIQENGRNVGIVTARGLVGELVGHIDDEFDAARHLAEHQAANRAAGPHPEMRPEVPGESDFEAGQ